MASFKEQSLQVFETDDYRQKLQSMLNKGVSKFSMASNVFELGVKLQRHITAASWAAWMTGAELIENYDSVIITHKTQFRLEYARNTVGFNIGQHFRKPIIWQLEEKQKQATLQLSYYGE